MTGAYRARQFAVLAGVSVRTLHHYDRLGLLKAARNSAGYRVYRVKDLVRLEQIVALKYIGMPLKEIGALLGRATPPLADALRMQRRILEEKQDLLQQTIHAIQAAEAAIVPGETDAARLRRIIEVIGMEKNGNEWFAKYAELVGAKIKTLQRWTPELQAKAERDWSELFRDVEQALGEDPGGRQAQALADRWLKLLEGFTGGDPKLAGAVRAFYQDRENWPAAFHKRMEPFKNPQVWEFMSKAMAARQRT